MKASRDQLKQIMKELLVEILSEGLGNVQHAASSPPGHAPIVGMASEQRAANGRRKPAFDPRLDNPVSNGRKPTDALRDAIMRESRGNPVLADMLADTAMTTLPAQLAHGDGGAPSGTTATSQQEQFNGSPADVFGAAAEPRADGSTHWADLAFMPAKKSM